MMRWLDQDWPRHRAYIIELSGEVQFFDTLFLLLGATTTAIWLCFL